MPIRSLNPSSRLSSAFGEIDIYLFDQLLRGRFDHRHRILDAGCGSGRNLVYLLRSGFDVFGIDSDPAAIVQVRALAAELAPSLSTEQFLVGDIESLPWPGESMDAVLCSAVLHFADDEHRFGRMLQEMWRVLRPGGLLFARLASLIGLEVEVQLDRTRRARLPDGTVRFLVDEAMLLDWTRRLDAHLLDPVKTTNVQNRRCMTTWVLEKRA